MSRISQSSKHIYLQDIGANTPEKSIFSYDMEADKVEPSFEMTMMKEFNDLNLSHEEKILLSTEHRKIIYKYKSIKQNQLKKIGKEVFQTITEEVKKKVDIRIKAKGIMAYFCLAAIYSGKLPSNKHIIFELSAIPLSLFPKDLVKKSTDLPEIVFFIENENWISQFKSLYQCPKYMSLNHSYVDRTKLIKFAA